MISELVFLLCISQSFTMKVKLEEGTQAYKWWVKPPVTPTLKLYFYNVTNADDVMTNGSKPILEEIGPYVYSEKREKKNVKFHRPSISFNLERLYFFEQSQSNGSESDVVTVPNIPFLGTALAMQNSSIFVRLAFNMVTRSTNTRPFINVTVGELLWGYEDDFLRISTGLPRHLSVWPYPKFGLLYERNGTSSDRISIYTADSDSPKFGLIDEYNGNSTLPFYNDSCSSIEASDGSIFPQNIAEDTSIYVFDRELCRRLPLVFETRVRTSGGIQAYRFTPPKNVFDNGEENPENTCFCSTDSTCLPSGFFDASRCQHNASILLSFPHFYLANDSYRAEFEGVSPPDAEVDSFYVDIQPKLGITMAAKARLQINTRMKSLARVTNLDKLPDVIFPIMWFEQGFDSLPNDVNFLINLATYSFF